MLRSRPAQGSARWQVSEETRFRSCNTDINNRKKNTFTIGTVQIKNLNYCIVN